MKSRGANDGFWHLTIFFKERDYLDLHQSYFFVLFSERRAHSNLGNAHIFLGEFERAADHYKRTLLLAQDLGDRAVEAQACYSLGNTYTLLKDYPNAIEYHLRHLRIAQELFDKVGEGRSKTEKNAKKLQFLFKCQIEKMHTSVKE